MDREITFESDSGQAAEIDSSATGSIGALGTSIQGDISGDACSIQYSLAAIHLPEGLGLIAMDLNFNYQNPRSFSFDPVGNFAFELTFDPQQAVDIVSSKIENSNFSSFKYAGFIRFLLKRVKENVPVFVNVKINIPMHQPSGSNTMSFLGQMAMVLATRSLVLRAPALIQYDEPLESIRYLFFDPIREHLDF